ncbi:MAG: ankyrin repeat domain-containing protein [Verrucomicrobiota bacterium]|jgi:ankyrin repeat protein
MIRRLLLPVLLCPLLAGTACRKLPEDRARERVHAAGYAYSIDDFLRAAAEGREAVVLDFLEAGMQPDVMDAAGQTAVDRAAASGQGHIARLLLSRRASPWKKEETSGASLIAAARSGDMESVNALLGTGVPPDFPDPADDTTPLLEAAWHGHTAIVRRLASLDPAHVQDALGAAAARNHTGAMAALLEAGADPLRSGKDGLTALMRAAREGHQAAAELLVQRGALITAIDSEGRAAADLADSGGHGELAALLRSQIPSAPEGTDPPLTSWEGDPPAALADTAAQIGVRLTRPRQWPFTVVAVTSEGVGIRRLPLSESDTVLALRPGESVPGTPWKLRRGTPKSYSLIPGNPRKTDQSEALFLNPETGEMLLAIRGCLVAGPGREAVVETDGQTHVLQESDVFAAGDLRIRVAEISLRRIVLREEAGPGEAVLEVPR